MDRIRAHIITLICIVSVLPSFGQFTLSEKELSSKLSNIPQEYTFVHSTNSLYLAGEYMYYSLYCFNADTKRLTALSKISYVELVNENGERIFKHKLRLENGVGSGDFFIPTTTPTGAYKLLGYSQWMQNGPIESIFSADITIVNPYRSTTDLSIQNSTIDTLQTVTDKPLQVLSKDPTARMTQLSINKLNFKKRELVSLDLSGLGKSLLNGHYSLSVRRYNSLPAPKQPRIDHYLNDLSLTPYRFNSPSRGRLRIPELRGELFLARVRSKNARIPVDNLHLSISIPGDNSYFTVVKSDQNGFFYFNIDQYYSGSEIIFDVIDAQTSDYSFELIDQPLASLKELAYHEVHLDSSIQKNLLARSVANQIENAYFKFKPDSIKVPRPGRFFDDYQGKKYLLDDFTRFKTIRETIFEYVKDVVIRRVNSSKSVVRIKGYNFGTNSLALPLVLLDGVVIQDHNSLLDFESGSIASIEVFRDQFIIGPQTYQGALVVQSKTGQSPTTFDRFGLPRALALFRPEDAKNYFKQRYDNRDTQQRLPDYRYQLLWQPVKKFSEQDFKIEFYTSDVSGTFEVLLQGVTKEGKPIAAFQVFTVND